MTEPLATYAFLPWLRRGIGADIARVDGTSGAEPRVAIPVEVRFNRDDALSGTVDLALFGPGDIRSLDARAVIRTWPRAGVMDAEPNYFPLVEFDQADLPWRYTPARATAKNRLTPWIALVVLADDEVADFTPPRGSSLGRVTVKDAAVLPPQSQLWAWAHAQVGGATTVDEATAADLLAKGSSQLIARLLAPRRMKPRTSYTGILVPTFQRGLLAGLGQPVPDTVDALTPAWTDAASGPITLPVYHSWRFGTGQVGDFESLARLLQPFEAPASVGIRDMDVTAPSPGMPKAASSPLGLEGMLLALGTQETAWPAGERATWIGAVKPLLNLPADRLAAPGGSPRVTPPLYGRWPAAADRCQADAPSPRPAWFQTLNVDPRLRTGAALGTQVIQANQEPLMASAWDQVDRVRQLNEELRQAQLAREMATRLFTRHVVGPDAGIVLAVTAPLLTRLKASPTTVRAVLNESPVPRGVFEGAFRRVARPLGPLGRRQGRAAAPARPGLVDRLNRGALAAARPPPPPSGMVSGSTRQPPIAPPGQTRGTVDERRRGARRLVWLAVALLVIALLLFLAGVPIAGFIVLVLAVVAGNVSRTLARTADDLGRRIGLRDGTLTGFDVRSARPPASFTPQAAPAGGAPRTLPVTPAGESPSPATALAFREAAALLAERIAAPEQPIRTATMANLPALRDTVLSKLRPESTFAAAYENRFAVTPGAVWEPDDPIEPINAAPEFPQPMYEPLKKLSPDWLLPGLSQIPRNRITLLKTNPKMVEAFMVGLNHEMARELLWREYPTEQRATYFQQFWDSRGAVPPPGQTLDPKTLRDITPIHTWPKGSALGKHSPREPVLGGGDYLVLLIRGDLLQRYPNTVVYAARAKWLSNGLRDIDDPPSGATPDQVAALVRWPLFAGFLDPDATFFGFALTANEVRGSTDPAGDPGWFFVLQEHSSEPRFGLDESDATTLGRPVVSGATGGPWANLSWGHLAADAAALAALSCVDLDAELPDTTQVHTTVAPAWHADHGRGSIGSRSSDLAYITFQRPMRVGIHGEDMVP